MNSQLHVIRTSIGLLALVLTSSFANAEPIYSGPIKISAPGTYTGNYRSTDPGTPAVEIYTNGEVILENCNVTAPGALIRVWSETRLTVRNCNGYGMGDTPGKFLETANLKSLTMLNNYVEGVSKAALLYQFRGKGGPNETIKIIGNVARNIRGQDRPSFVQFNQVIGVSDVEIAYNQVVNEPGQSAVEDNINIYNSSGTTSSPIRVHDNYVQGAYPRDLGHAFTGTGMTTDGDGNLAMMVGNVEATGNQFISTCNAAMNMAGGYNIRFHHNRMISSSMQPGGSGEIPVGCTWAGTASWNNFNLPAGSPLYSNNSIDHNVIGFVRKGISKPFADRQDLSPDCPAHICKDNTHLPNPITLNAEKNEWALWNQKLAASGMKIGSDDHSNDGRRSVGKGTNVFFGPANGSGTPVPDPTSAPAPTPTPAPTQTPAPTPTGSPTGESWKVIGHENERLTVPANSTVRYGARGAYVQKHISGTFEATNSFFGHDPIPGVHKEVGLLTGASAPAPSPAPVPSLAPEDEWKVIGREHDSLTVASGTVVRYGAQGKYVQKTVSGTFRATNDFFGDDPIPGVLKEVAVRNGTVTAPAPAPEPAGTWKRIGAEYDVLTVPDHSTVKYGNERGHVIRTVSGRFGASNEFFGGDPSPGYKEVWLLVK